MSSVGRRVSGSVRPGASIGGRVGRRRGAAGHGVWPALPPEVAAVASLGPWVGLQGICHGKLNFKRMVSDFCVSFGLPEIQFKFSSATQNSFFIQFYFNELSVGAYRSKFS